MTDTVKAMAGTRNPVNPLDVINNLVTIIGQQRVIVAGIRKNGKQFAGELFTIKLGSQIIEVDNDGFVDSIRFEDIASIEQTN